MREGQHIALDRTDLLDEPFRTCRDIPQVLTTGTAMLEGIPAWMAFADLRREQAFVLAVIPLQQILIQLECAGESRELTGLSRALQRTAKHLREGVWLQARLQIRRVPLALRSQCNVSQPRVLTTARPLGFAVPDQPKLCKHSW